MTAGWTEDRVGALKKLWLEGQSASQIAKQLGGGVTRNAVIGRLHRDGLMKSGVPAARLEARERPRPPKPVRQTPSLPALVTPSKPRPVKVKLAQPKPVSVAGEKITIVNLEPAMCKWPVGDPQHTDFHFCGNARHDDAPYCEFHCEVAYATSVTNQRLKKTTSENKVMARIRAR